MFKNTSRGLGVPTSMEFLGPDDILVLEISGDLQRIVNGVMLSPPLLHLPVAEGTERGLLGISVGATNESSQITYVFIYYTGTAVNGTEEAFRNRLYRYEFKNDTLQNPKLLLNLPAEPGPKHMGGKVTIGPDGSIYFTIGDLDEMMIYNFTSLNFASGTPADGRGGILRVNQEGEPVEGIIGDRYPLNLYYAYGIRNSFGIDFDPITGNLWDTENGPDFGDEINLVEPGFNSGWAKVQGIWELAKCGRGDTVTQPADLVSFNGKGKYSIPELIWVQAVAPTAIKFFNSDEWGEEYKNDLLVSDFNYGNIYHFDLNQDRSKLIMNYSAKNTNDTILINRPSDLNHNLLAQVKSEGGIADLEVGPDGNLYVLFIGYNNNGGIYKISLKDNN